MSQEAKAFADDLVAPLKPIWSDLTSRKLDPRKAVIHSIAIDTARGTLKGGIAGAFLEACARNGDRSAYELMVQLGMTPEFPRPKRQGGRGQTGMRNFIVFALALQLQEKHRELSFGANDATAPGTSAVDMIRQALEDAGLPCIDRRKAPEEEAGARSMERALRDIRKNPKYREWLDPAWREAYEAGFHDS